MNQRLRHRASVLKHVYPECVQDVDGYWKWWPKSTGLYTQQDLLVVADLLREANRLWDEEVRCAFS